MLLISTWLFLSLSKHYVYGEDTVECPSKWIKFQNLCYRVYNRPVTFSAAEIGCQDDFKGRLAIINSKEKSDFIISQYFTPKNKFRKNTWIALIRTLETNVDSSFQWLDKSPVNYTNWQHGEPNNFWGLQYCVALWGGKKHPGTWFDYWCDTEMFALCERDLLSNSESVELKEQPSSDAGVEKERTTWILLIITSVLVVILLVVVAVICYLADFTNAKRTMAMKTDVWFKRFSEDRISLDQHNNNNSRNSNFDPSEKVFNNLSSKT